MRRVPVIILSGFLGSGKTTLLLRLLKQANDRRLKTAVLMNELGQSDVDSGLIHADWPGASLENLLDGCMCCSKKSEVAGCIRRLIEQQPDVIFIELTGVANPEEVVEVLTDPSLLNRVELRHIITVLDSEWVLEYDSLFNTDLALKHTLRRQMEVADTILINKTDLASSSQLAKITKSIARQNDKAAVHYTRHSDMDLNPVFSSLQPAANSLPAVSRGLKVSVSVRKRPESSAHTHEHSPGPGKEQEHTAAAGTGSFTRVKTVTLAVPEHTLITVKQADQFIQKWRDGLLRAKGYIAGSERKEPCKLVQFAGKRIYWSDTDYHGPSYLVFIGIDLDRQQIEQDWNRLLNVITA
ncbi:CobW family GTP-binding protein [Paenibacillus sambharensis]|nr:GTP-binding protein [Paenibacillus sambharensis]